MKVSFTVKDNSKEAEWILNQLNRGMSIKLLINNAIKQFGTDDLVSAALEQVGFGVEAVQRQVPKKKVSVKAKVEKSKPVVAEPEEPEMDEPESEIEATDEDDATVEPTPMDSTADPFNKATTEVSSTSTLNNDENGSFRDQMSL